MSQKEKLNPAQDQTKDRFFLSFMAQSIWKTLYEVCLATSEANFIIANLFSLQSLANDYLLKNLAKFLSTPWGTIFICLISFLFVIGYNLKNVFLVKQDEEITIKAKKIIDCILDGVRIIGYNLVVLLLWPFIFEEDQIELKISFYLMILSILLCILRKIYKWGYFYCNEEGRKITKPWEVKKKVEGKEEKRDPDSETHSLIESK